MTARSLLALAALLGGLVPLACGSDEPLPIDGTGTTSDAGTGDAKNDAKGDADQPDGEVDAGPTVRTVETRSRFGALDPSNHLLDGDFEYSGADALQYTWFGLDYEWIVTGARCHGGLRCAEIPQSRYAYAFGVFVWPDSASASIEYFAKPLGTGNCTEEVGGLLIPLSEYPGAPQDLVISATNPNRDADGWCHVTTSVPVPEDTGNGFWAMLLAPRQRATGGILVDDASIRASSGGTQTRSLRLEPAMAPLVARARADFAARPPLPPRAEPTPVKNRTGRRK